MGLHLQTQLGGWLWGSPMCHVWETWNVGTGSLFHGGKKYILPIVANSLRLRLGCLWPWHKKNYLNVGELLKCGNFFQKLLKIIDFLFELKCFYWLHNTYMGLACKCCRLSNVPILGLDATNFGRVVDYFKGLVSILRSTPNQTPLKWPWKARIL